jgi:malonyl CoA-acyl carrier protein transacylase
MLFIMFTGQGSQQLNMGKDFFDQFQVAKDTMLQCEEALGYKLSEKIFCDNAEDLNKTIHTQPAIMANGMMIYNSLLDICPTLEARIAYMAGHSVGEYNALCANGFFGVNDGVKLLRARAEFMENACPVGRGGMAAILKINHDSLSELISDSNLDEAAVCAIANDNGAEQIVISGDMDAIDKVCTFAKSNNIRAIKLNVSGPFHSPLMVNASKNMEAELKRYKFNVNNLTAKIISNVTADVFPNDEFEIKKLLVDQIISPVRWRETILNVYNNYGIKNFIEIGPKSVLTGLLKNTLPQDQIKFDFIGSVNDMEAFLNKDIA